LVRDRLEDVETSEQARWQAAAAVPLIIRTTSDFAEIVVAILSVTAKLERSARRILECTARGRADAKAKGVKFGRQPTLTPHQQKEARKRLGAGETQRNVARYNVSKSTILRLAP
jgi:DNA invertase Pin-like site-specific DNA recombinase